METKTFDDFVGYVIKTQIKMHHGLHSPITLTELKPEDLIEVFDSFRNMNTELAKINNILLDYK